MEGTEDLSKFDGLDDHRDPTKFFLNSLSPGQRRLVALFKNPFPILGFRALSIYLCFGKHPTWIRLHALIRRVSIRLENPLGMHDLHIKFKLDNIHHVMYECAYSLTYLIHLVSACIELYFLFSWPTHHTISPHACILFPVTCQSFFTKFVWPTWRFSPLAK